MTGFATGRDAKEYLVSAVVAEADRTGVALSETERKMMYFSETAWTLPDMMEVNDAFDNEYDQAEYEEKIAGLIRSLRRDARNHAGELERWDEAVGVLRREDHYLLVMIDVAGGGFRPLRRTSIYPSWGRFSKLVLVGGGLFLVCAVLLMLFLKFRS